MKNELKFKLYMKYLRCETIIISINIFKSQKTHTLLTVLLEGN